ncbi:hypothetical protein OERS_04630 [Oerskovia enterophila]|uniref:Uncharacterized protein n=1 Tax=Oerskovia enterophila TaxID=43678 RepID=A0ABX2YA10_9CELL|nr:hypothetical protein OERS_04630 [Oerskovia enterophila]
MIFGSMSKKVTPTTNSTRALVIRIQFKRWDR